VVIRSISCFAGCGGLDVAVELAIAGVEPVLYLENEIATAEILVARIKEGSLPPAHVWSDITTFDATQLRGKIDLVYGGFPCPDYSVAGKRAGIVGKHGQLWNSMRRIIREVGASWVFLENVPGILYGHPVTKWRAERDLFGRTIWTRYRMPAGLAFVLADLAEMGFDAEWGCLPAAAVGASHKRDRWFCLAYRPERGCGELWQSSRRGGFADGRSEALADAGCEPEQLQQRDLRAESPRSVIDVEDTPRHERQGIDGRREHQPGESTVDRWPGPARDGGQLANTTEPRLEIGRRERSDGECELATAKRSGGTVEHADSDRCEEIGRRAQIESAAGSGRDADIGSATLQSGAGLPIFAPGPSDPCWPDLLVRYPWMLPAISQAEAESDLRELAPGMADMVVHERADALRAVGNGVVAVQGAAILRELIRRVSERIAT